ncbi:vacuolar protein sorting-associated protein 16 [Meredithblackwellia eburnea MCA 4105]
MTTVAPASSSWEPLGDTFYRKTDIYSMQWSVQDLSDYKVAGARWGGPIAMIRDDSKPVLIGRAGLSKPKVSVFSSAGGLLQTITWDPPSRVIALGWTANESLVILTQDGTYRLYQLSTGSLTPVYTQHSLGSDAQQAGVIEAKIYEHGMVVLLGNLNFVEVKGWEKTTEDGSIGGKVVQLASAGLTEPPSSWCVIAPELSNTRGVEVLIGSGKTVLRLDEIDVQDQRLTRGPFLSITPSPNGRFLSLLSHPSDSSPQLWVASSDFTRSLSEFDLGNEGETGPPGQTAWCGNNTVVVAWDRTVVMVGPFGETLKYYYSDPVHLIGEIDGTRIISCESCEFLQIVPQSSQDVFRPGSASPSAILFEAAELFEKKSPKADEYIRNIRSELVGAVDTCIDAAGREFDGHWQKKLLKAASFGKTFLDLYNPSDFVQMTHTLRVLNAARYYEIGIPLTFDQYQAHPPSHLIARLTSRSQHLLSLRISNYLRISPAPVLKHWAQAKISSSKGGPESEEDICKIIVDKLRDQDDVSCADVAQTAWSTGQSALATKLLDFEPRSSKQVPLLLSMKQDDLALVKAIESGDPNLIYTVILHLRKVNALGDFFRLIDHKPEATSLLQVYARENDVELLRDFYFQDDRRKETACLALEESWAITEMSDKLAKVKAAQKAFGEDKDCSFEAKMVDDQLKLLTFQQTLEQESPGKSFTGLSINETIRACIIGGLSKKADKVRSDFKVPDKRFWYVKMKALVEVRDWEGLETFAKSKKSPIGYEPWVEHLISTGSHRQAVSFVARCEQKNRVELYVKTGEWVLAGQECLRKADRGQLTDLRRRCPNAVIGAELDQLLEEMTHGGM